MSKLADVALAVALGDMDLLRAFEDTRMHLGLEVVMAEGAMLVEVVELVAMVEVVSSLYFRGEDEDLGPLLRI